MTRQRIIAGILIASALVGGVGFGLQKYLSNRGKITSSLVPSLADEKEAFEITDPSNEETKKYPLEILVIKPNVENVAEVRQVSITFNKPMVALGDFEKSAQNLPVKIQPEIPCQWRWLNRTSLACQLDEPLPYSNRYTITVEKGFKAFDGTELQAAQKVVFSTEKWMVIRENIKWKDADLPVLYWTFNQPMDKSSLLKNISSNCGNFRVEDVLESEAEEFSIDRERTFALHFSKKLGLEKKCDLKLAKEAKSKSGPEAGAEFSTSFRTYPEFKITKVICGDDVVQGSPEGGKFLLKGCDPDIGVTIQFSSPVYGKDLANKINIKPFFGWSKGGYSSPEYFEQNSDEIYTSLSLQSPLEGSTTHNIQFSGIKDRFGRSFKGVDKIQISTIDFRPILKVNDQYGVIEKQGPHKISYSAVNLKDFQLDYFQSQSIDGLALWQKYKQRYNNCLLETFGKSSTTVETKGELNRPITNPIDIDKIVPNFKYGIFLSRIKNLTELENANTRTDNNFTRFCSMSYIVVTDLGILAKVGFYDSGVWIHSISTGKPLSNIKVQLRTQTKTISEGKTDSEGFVRFPGSIEFDPEKSIVGNWSDREDLFVVAQTNDDLSVLPFNKGAEGISAYAFSNYEDYEGGIYEEKLRRSSNHIVHAITDRPLYQPNQGVKIKLFARHWEPRTFGLKPETALKLRVIDSVGKEIYKADLKLSEYGTANTELKIPAGAPLGTYSINAEIAPSWNQPIGSFDVQEFTLPAFKVGVSAIKTRFLVGNSAAFRTSAQYHFGGGVADSKGTYTATFKEERWKPTLPIWNKFTFDDQVSLNLSGYEKIRSYRDFVLEDGSLKSNKDGDAFKSILLSPNQIRSFGTVSFESKFQDDKGKTIAGRSSAKVYYTDYQLGIRKDQWAYEAGEKIYPKVVLLNPEEAPVSDREVSLKLVFRKYQTVRTRGSGNYFGYETRTIDKVIDQCEVTSASSEVSCALKAKAAGSHYILAESIDSKKRITRSSLHLYVTGKDYVGWNRENHDRIDIIPDKRDYKLGEEISLLVKNPYEEVEGIFTLERFGILKKFRHKFTGGAELVKIPIDSKDYAPGFYVSLQLIKGRVSDKIEGDVDLGKPSFKMGMAKINVLDPDTVLEIAANTEKMEYEPGSDVNAEIRVTAPSGGKKSEISVAVVDEKILQLAGDYEGKFDLHNKFYQLKGVDVITSQMLSHIIGRRHYGKKGAPEGGDGDGITLRKNFLPLAYWNPALETDSSGKAKIKFKVPDNLTSWRILVVVVDKGHRFGFGSHIFKTNKKLMIEPALPSFLTEGDQLKGRFSIFNRTGQNSDIWGNLKVQGLELLGAAEQKIGILDGGKGFFEWFLKAPVGLPEAKLTVSAKSEKTGDQDGAQYTFPILPFASYETFATYGSTTKDKVSIPLDLPKGIRTEMGGLEMIYSTTLISHLDDVFRYGLNYPYDCWEQKLVRIMMLNSYVNLKEYVSIPELTRDPKAWMQEILNLMPNYQAPNGGMSYWLDSDRTVDPYLSAFTALSLIWLNQSKVAIPDLPAKKVFAYTKDLMNGIEQFPQNYSTGMKNSVLAMIVHVQSLLGEDVTSTVNRLFQERTSLSLFGKSFLWSTAARSDSTKAVAETLKKEIFSMADLTSGTIQFQEKLDDGYQRILHSTTRTNCNLLTTLLEHDTKGPFVEPLVRWIIGTRKSNRWNNTQENLYCLNALVNYAKIFEKETPDFKVSSTALGENLEKVSMKGYQQGPKVLKVNFANKEAKFREPIEITKEGPGRLYYTNRIKVAYKDIRQDSVNSGMALVRTYFVKDKGNWIPQTNQVKIKRGDLVKIVLKANVPAVRYQVALADSLPAGLEPLNTALAATSATDARDQSDNSAGGYEWSEDEGDGDGWWGYYYSGGFYHKEMRLFGAQYFADFLSSGEYKVEYVAQAIAVGEFNVSPAIIEEMYDPEVYGKSTPAKFIISE